MKKICILLIVTILLGAVALYAENMKADISSAVLRLHVVANSNSKYDQALKLKVRDAVRAELAESIKYAESKEDAILSAKKMKDELTKAALNVLRSEGAAYSVNVTVGKEGFPTKEYGKIALPSGEYDAVNVKIGAAQGENWWCVLYPPLCITDSSCLEVDDSAYKVLSKALTEEELKVITREDGTKISLKFKLLEIF